MSVKYFLGLVHRVYFYACWHNSLSVTDWPGTPWPNVCWSFWQPTFRKPDLHRPNIRGIFRWPKWSPPQFRDRWLSRCIFGSKHDFSNVKPFFRYRPEQCHQEIQFPRRFRWTWRCLQMFVEQEHKSGRSTVRIHLLCTCANSVFQVAVKCPRFPSLGKAEIKKINQVCFVSVWNCYMSKRRFLFNVEPSPWNQYLG